MSAQPMKIKIKQYNLLNQFSCVGDKCENHCCGTWNVGVDKKTVEKYEREAPELLKDIEKDSDDDGYSLAHNPETKFCSQLDKDNLCSIHKKYGHKMLPEICRHYPRTYRAIDDKVLASATTSCPEITRICLFGEDPFKLVDSSVEDFPMYISNYGKAGESSDDILYVIRRFYKETTRKDISASQIMMRLISISMMLDHYKSQGWRKVIDSIFDNVDYATLPCHTEEYATPVEPYLILKYLYNIRVGGHPRWYQMFKTASDRLGGIDFDAPIEETRGKVNLDPAFIQRVVGNKATMKKLNWVLKRFIGGDFMRAMFPYSGVGNSAYERAMVLAGQYAVVRLLLILHADDQGNCPSDDDITRVVQTVSRHTTHLSRNVVQYYRDCQMDHVTRIKEAVFLFEDENAPADEAAA